MENRLTVLVVDDTHFYRHGAKLEHAGDMDLGELLCIAEDLKAKNIWLVPGTDVSRACAVPGELPGWNITATYADAKSKNFYSYVSARRNNARHEDHIEIGFTEFSRWPWHGDNARVVLSTVHQLEGTLGIPIAWTPAHISLDLIRELNKDRWHWWQPMRADLEKSHEGFSYVLTAHELHWPGKGQEVQGPAGATHEVRLDGNGAYAAGMTGLNIGEGEPRDVHGSYFDGKRPGFWRVQLDKKESIFDGKRLPEITGPWLTTDMINQLYRSGYDVTIKDGVCWEKYHQALRSTAEFLWKAETEWRAKKEEKPESYTCQNVYDSIRSIRKAIHGKLARNDNNEHFNRRDVWCLTVCRSVAMTMYRIEKIYKEYGLLPVAIKADELKYAVDNPNMLNSLIERDKLGGLKLVEKVLIQ